MIPPDPSDPASSILELDELWSNARAKDEPDLGLDCTLPLHPKSASPMRSEIAANRPVAGCGKPFQQHTERVTAQPPSGGPTKQCYQRNSIRRKAPETGETAHVERWNNTLRQRLARFVRKTLSFSKSGILHEACLRLFLHRYNLDRALMLM
jgi:hypothetical protein